jgi:hypothetical protein
VFGVQTGIAVMFLVKSREANSMNAQLMMQPSSFIDAGIQMQSVKGLYLFKFSEPLQARLEVLNAKQREANLSADEEVELTGILELDRIFTLLNAKIIAESA